MYSSMLQFSLHLILQNINPKIAVEMISISPISTYAYLKLDGTFCPLSAVWVW